MAAKENPMSAALSQGAARRRTPGETAGKAPVDEPEKLMTISIPLSMHKELKALCAQADVTIKQVVTRGTAKEMALLRKLLEGM